MSKKKRKKWRWIPGYEGLYKVSVRGRIKSYHRSSKGIILRGGLDKFGYRRIILYKNKKRYTAKVHQLVLFAFRGEKKPGQVCRHLDGNQYNNRLSNLRWGTQKENSDDKRLHHTMPSGEKSYSTKLTEKQVIKIRKLYASGKRSTKELAKRYNVAKVTINFITTGRSWKDAPGPITRKLKRLTKEDVSDLREEYTTGKYTKKELSYIYGTNVDNINRLLTGTTWKSVGGPVIEKTSKPELTKKQVRTIRKLYATGNWTQQELAEHYGLSRSSLADIVVGRTWNHVGGPITKSKTKPRTEITPKQVRKIRRLYATGDYLQKDLAEHFGFSKMVVNGIVNNRTHVTV